MHTILVAEDEPEVRNYLGLALSCSGYQVEFAHDGEEVVEIVQSRQTDVSLVLMDIIMPRKDGIEALAQIRRLRPDLPVLMLSGAASPSNVVAAMKNGASDFLWKPVSHEELRRAIENALQSPSKTRTIADAASHNIHVDEPYSSSAAGTWSENVELLLKRVGSSEVPVLLQGETGVGKEVLARKLHAKSPRANRPFLKLNCAALPSELIESELFGYERGAFTGAFKSTPGKFEMAEGGTILLDEIGDMDFKLQAKLLQVLQDREFLRLGGKETSKVDVRVMAATHQDLEKAIREGRFREDLYYRLNIIDIHIPALRERRDEILPLSNFFLQKYAESDGPLEVTPRLKMALLEYDWPGNIRQLENVMRKYLVLRNGDLIAEELRKKAKRATALARAAAAGASPAPVPEPLPVEAAPRFVPDPTTFTNNVDSPVMNRDRIASYAEFTPPANLKSFVADRPVPQYRPAVPEERVGSILAQVDDARKAAESEAIVAALNSTLWNRKAAAQLLKIDYKALLYKMKKLGIGEQTRAAAVAAG